ncbi:MAG: hypothetical protein JNM88_12480 [Chitinophagaceae bacterium]|nr:hypothetical protein [Chitinophagaceae bacterium]
MKKNPESGNIKNLASMQLLISYCTQMGSKYNPANQLISLARLRSLYTTAALAQDEVNNRVNEENNAKNLRYYAFQGLGTLCSSVVASYTSGGASIESIRDAQYLLRKVQGRRAKAIEPPPAVKEGETAAQVNHISASQSGMDQQINHFSRLITLLSADSIYKPNEEELTLEKLADRLELMKKRNEEVLTATAILTSARSQRNIVMYDHNAGMVDMALLTKKYVRSVYQGKGDEFKKINSIPFRNYRPKKKQSR